MIPLPEERLHALFENTGGFLRWRVKKGKRVRAGNIAGSLDKASGYLLVQADGRKYKVHRIIYTLHHGDPGNLQIDHIDGNKANNTIENLRVATNTQNLHNTGARRDSSTGVKGVRWCETHWKYRADGRANGKRRHLGYFDTIPEAAAAYQRFAREHHKEFYREKNQ